jgi:ferredoxin
LKILVDYDACESNGLCVLASPDVFELDEEDNLHLRTDEPPSELIAGVEAAVRACPKQALRLVGRRPG